MIVVLVPCHGGIHKTPARTIAAAATMGNEHDKAPHTDCRIFACEQSFSQVFRCWWNSRPYPCGARWSRCAVRRGPPEVLYACKIRRYQCGSSSRVETVIGFAVAIVLVGVLWIRPWHDAYYQID